MPTPTIRSYDDVMAAFIAARLIERARRAAMTEVERQAERDEAYRSYIWGDVVPPTVAWMALFCFFDVGLWFVVYLCLKFILAIKGI